MQTIAAQLLAAFKDKEWSLAELLERTTLDCDVTSLGRKLNGRQKLSTAEAEHLAEVLGEPIEWRPSRRRKVA